MSNLFPMFDEVIDEKPYRPLTDWAGKVGLATTDTAGHAEGDIAALVTRLAVLEDRVASMNKTNVTPVVSTSTASVEDKAADLVIAAGETPVTEKSTITGKSIAVKSMNVNSAIVNMTAESGDVTVTNYVSTGELSGSPATISINTNEYVKVSNCSFGQKSYNGLEIGLSKTAPKSVIIDNVEFGGKLKNNAISIFSHAEDAVITISNCHFADVSNCLRISNRDNVSCTINVINCVVDSWAAGVPTYSGFIIFQDYSSGSVEKEETNNLFGKNKITVNFINCTGPNGKKFTDFGSSAEFCGTSNNDQLVYVWRDKSKCIVPYGDGSFYPTINVK